MDVKLFTTVFITIFLAELGDKTQLATMIYAADSAHARLGVFAAAALALTLSAGLSVLAGGLLGAFVSPRAVRLAGALCFIAVGLWMLLPVRAG
jgi:putative Ca2+/H+ antiporter (TMEM165/GDT1 family)